MILKILFLLKKINKILKEMIYILYNNEETQKNS